MTRPEEPSRPGENFEPYEEMRQIPIGVIMFAVALALWGGVLLYQSSYAVAVGRADETVLSPQSEQGLGLTGAKLFEANCTTCHQPGGEGVEFAIPPLDKSPFLAGGPEIAASILLRGIDGPIRVGDETFDGHMPSFASALDDAEIARLATYLQVRFTGRKQAISGDGVAALRREFADAGPFAGGQAIAARFDSSLSPQPEVTPLTGGKGISSGILELVNQGRGEVWSCSSCHGDRGQGADTVPRLAGLPADYIAKQLLDYTEGRRRNENMELVARSLSEKDREGLGRYYASMRAASTARPSLGGNLERGRELVLSGDWSIGVPSCTSCHGPSAFGVAPGFPGLAAQHPSYTASQLAAWVSGERDNSRQKMMNVIANALNDRDRAAVADYLATLPPVPAPAATADEVKR